MTTKCRKCDKFARQESHRPDHLGCDGIAWRPFCETHLKQQISKYALMIRSVGRPQGTTRA